MTRKPIAQQCGKHGYEMWMMPSGMASAALYDPCGSHTFRGAFPSSISRVHPNSEAHSKALGSLKDAEQALCSASRPQVKLCVCVRLSKTWNKLTSARSFENVSASIRGKPSSDTWPVSIGISTSVADEPLMRPSTLVTPGELTLHAATSVLKISKNITLVDFDSGEHLA